VSDREVPVWAKLVRRLDGVGISGYLDSIDKWVARASWVVFLAILLVGTPGLAVRDAAAEDTGNISGKVVDGKTKEPLAFANVLVVGTGRGAMSRVDGSYFITSVPIGVHSVQATYMGYEPQVLDGVTVESYKTAVLEVELFSTVVMTLDEVVSVGERPLVEVENPATMRRLRAEELENMPVEDLQDVVELQAGVVESDDEIHIRGGRADETLYIVDGIKMRDTISGTPLLSSVSPRSVAEVNVITGGFDAEYGQAMSGVVEVTLKEGGGDHSGSVYYSVDHNPLFDVGPESFNTDEFELTLSGPDPFVAPALRGMGLNMPGHFTYFAQFNTYLTDTYLPSISELGAQPKSSYEDAFLGMNWGYGRLSPRQQNDWKGIGKLVWQTSNHKLTFTATKSISIGQGFFSSNPYDIQRERSRYPWSWSRRLDHFPTSTTDANSLSLMWTHTLSAKMIQRWTLTRFFHAVHEDVAAKMWWEYEEPQDNQGLEPALDTPYFYDTGDGNTWHDRWSETWTLDWDLTRNFPPHHQLKTGFEATTQNIQYVIIQDPYYTPDIGFGQDLTEEELLELRKSSLGYFHDIFHIWPAQGALYVRDKFDFEGLIGTIGLRYDVWFPSDQVTQAIEDTTRGWITSSTRDAYWEDTREVFGHRMKGHLSPRIGISHPITDRDNLYFNYGHFSQWPSYIWVYSKLSSVSAEDFPLIGNPNLNPEISVQYELGARHQFTKTLAADLTLFYKDIYDYPSSTQFSVLGVGQFLIYRNVDFARSRGIEISIKKNRSKYFSGSLSYSYSIATGKSSDPNEAKLIEEAGGSVGTYEPELDEGFLYWNRPHKLNITMDFRIPGTGTPPSLLGLTLPRDSGLNIQWLIQSGRAYTKHELDQEVGELYAENGPYDNIVNLRADKTFHMGGRKLKFFLNVRNLFNNRSMRRFDRDYGGPYELGKGENWQYTMENLLNSNSFENAQRILQYNDSRIRNPSYYGEPRSARLGMVVEW
jgi:outer membrane receptor protein involved in Fe transport